MSRIFSPEELAMGKVPMTRDFELSLRYIHLTMQEEKTGLIAGLHFGSTHPKRNDLDITSDIDLLVVYDDEWKDYAYSAMMKMVSFAANRNVPLQIIPFSRNITEGGFHTIGEDFAHHLNWAALHGGVINKNPMDFIVPHTTRWDASAYVMGKLSSILKGFVRHSNMSEEERRTYLRKVLDVPSYLGRKVLWEIGEKLYVDSKSQVQEAYDRLVGGRAAYLFREIQSAKASYNKNVQENYNSRTSGYEFFLLSLENQILNVIELLELNAEILRKIKK